MINIYNYFFRYLEEIIESTLALYAINQNGSQGGSSLQLSPVHFIALIDPKAQWFIKWMVCSIHIF